MGSETMKLPIIDFSGIKEEDTTQWANIRNQVLKALESFGCFEATLESIPQFILDSTIDAIKQLFVLPLQTKLRNRSNKPYHGYVGQYSMVPLYESMGIDHVLSPEKLEDFTNTMWPEERNSFFSTSIRSFSEQISELDKTVRRMVLESLNLDKYMDEHMDSTNYLVRVQKYDEPKSSNSELGLSSHTDKNIVTILYQNEVNGLEILTKDGQWIAVEPSKNSFVVMIGESFHAWTNGRLHSPYHKVMMKGNRARYSIGLFSIPKSGYTIKVPEEMVDEDHPLLFKPFDHVEFLDFYYSEAGQRSPAALKAYCGA